MVFAMQATLSSHSGATSTISGAAAASNNDITLERGANDLSPQQKELILDLTQVTLDLIGIVDPTGAADVASGLISARRGDWLGAGISALGLVLKLLPPMGQDNLDMIALIFPAHVGVWLGLRALGAGPSA